MSSLLGKSMRSSMRSSLRSPGMGARLGNYLNGVSVSNPQTGTSYAKESVSVSDPQASAGWSGLDYGNLFTGAGSLIQGLGVAAGSILSTFNQPQPSDPYLDASDVSQASQAASLDSRLALQSQIEQMQRQISSERESLSSPEEGFWERNKYPVLIGAAGVMGLAALAILSRK